MNEIKMNEIKMNIDIYKKHLNLAKEKNTCPEWTELGKKVFAEEIEEYPKYKIMIFLASFTFLHIKDGVYYFAAPKIYANYIRFYEGFMEQLKAVKIKLVVNK